MKKDYKTNVLSDTNFDGHYIFLRADLNVPTINKTITNNHKLSALLPTIDLILQNNGKILLATHRGRPQKHVDILSTKHLIPWFKNHGYTIEFAKDIETAKKKQKENLAQIILLENLRFFPEELSGDKKFAQQLASLGTYYVNDAFGVMHRPDTSLTLVPKFFKPEKKMIGLLVKKELYFLNKLLEKKQKPFVVILGGAKIKTKLPLLKRLLGLADTILLCPAPVFTFLKALGKPVGKSLIDDSLLDDCLNIINMAKEKNTKIVFPVDYQIAHNSFDGITSDLDSTSIPNNAVGVSIGPKTARIFSDEIKKAKTAFYNGVIGNEKKEATLKGMKNLLTALAQTAAFTVIGGGDTVAVAQQLGFTNDFDFCSTGGGATLAYLAGESLPALDVFDNDA